MGYTLKLWKKRTRSRNDLSNYLTHLTRGDDKNSGIDILIKILTEKTIIASNNSGFIIGANSAVCFQDAPINGICQNTYFEQMYRKELGGKVRYKPIGLSFDKRYVFLKGGRPVLYEQNEIAKKLFDKREYWRIVSYDLTNEDNIIDWTHEREWRHKGDFHFDLKDTTVLLLNKNMYKEFLNKIDINMLNELGGIIVLDSILT